MSSFSQDQVRTFRHIFSQYSDAERGGLTRDKFVPAASASLNHCNLRSRPSDVYLAGEFSRLAGESGVVNWQQFFQVLIHVNLQFGRGSTSAPPPDVPTENVTSGSSRVHFTPSTIDPIPDVPTAPPPQERSIERSFGLTLRRGAGILGNVLGDFFGVTEVSQHGNRAEGRIGWEQYTERRVEEESVGGVFNTIARRASTRRTSQRGRGYSANEPPPDYPAVAAGRSFNLDELSDSDDDNAFTAEAPPDYEGLMAQSDPWFPAGGVAVETSLMLREEPQHYPAPTRPAGGVEHPPPAIAQDTDLIFDKDQAWDYYQKFIKAEKRLRQRRHRDDAVEFFGTNDFTGTSGHHDGIRRERLASLDQPASSEVQRRKKKKKKPTKLQRQSTLIRREVESLPTFWPVFIILLSIGQVAAMIVLVALPSIGLAPINAFPIRNIGPFPSLLDPSLESNVTYYTGVNIWIGPSATNLIRFGAKFTPCMRTDFGIRRRNADLYANPVLDDQIGCCRNQIHQGSVELEQCVVSVEGLTNTTGISFDPSNVDGRGRCANETFVNFHPCCISITGLCQVMDTTQCSARGGTYHPEAATCDQVNCLRDICQFNGVGIGDENGDPNRPTAQQFWRWFTSPFIHLGILHIVIIIPIQLYIGIKIERTIGWLRISLIYLISGVGGNIISAIFVPYGVNAGASGALFGLLAVLYVELFQFWQIVDRAYLELLKLTAFVVFLLALGTLPYVDNMSHIGGLLFGLPAAIIFVPYITFGKWDSFRKRILLIICIPVLLALFLAGFLTFYFIPDPSFCSFCHYINCVPYVEGFCPEEFNNPNTTIFSL